MLVKMLQAAETSKQAWPTKKKLIVWEKVAKREPQINWLYTKNNTLKKENFDQTDAYTCVLGYMRNKKIWE